MHGAPAVAAIQTIDRHHQPLPAALLFRGQVHQQVVLQQGVGLQGLQQHTGLLQRLVGLEHTVHEGQRGRQQHGRVGGRQQQAGGGGTAVEAGAVKGAAAHEHGDAAAEQFLVPQFFGGAAEIGGHRLLEALQAAHRFTEAAADADLLLRWRHGDQGQTRVAPQLLLQPQGHHPVLASQFGAGHVPQFAGIGDPPKPQPAGAAAADSPDVLHGDPLQPGIGIGLGPQVKDPPMAEVPLGDPVGELGQHLGGGDAHSHR